MKRIVKYGVVLTSMAAVCGGLLAKTYAYTKPYIDKIAVQLEQNAREEVFGKGYTFKAEEKKLIDNFEFIPAYKEENLAGYVVKVTSKQGYAGDIVFSMGIDNNAKITGLKVIESKETPGLGAKIQGETIINGEKLPWGSIWIGRDKDYQFDKKTDAFAGATISPRAVYSGVKDALIAYEKISENQVDIKNTEEEKSMSEEGEKGEANE